MLRTWINTSSQTLNFGLHHHPDGAGMSVTLAPGVTIDFDFGDDEHDDSRSAWLKPVDAGTSGEKPADTTSGEKPADTTAGATDNLSAPPVGIALAPGEIATPPTAGPLAV